jgi:hypothetical protein
MAPSDASPASAARCVNLHQYPCAGEVFLDHVAVFADDLDEAGRVFERLGFTLTPYRAHTGALRPGDPVAPLGTANRSAMLRTGYIEMLGATGDTPLADQLRAALARYRGLHLIAFTGFDADAHHAALAADGLAPLPIATAERTQSTPEGETTIRARIVRLPPDAWPEGRVQCVFPQMSADALWHPDLVDHANAADRLSEMLLVVDDPRGRAHRFGRFACRPVRAAGDRYIVETDRGRLHLVAPAQLPRYADGLACPAVPFMAAVAIGSGDLGRTRAWLAAHGVAHREWKGTVQTDARDTLGATFIFHDRDDDRVFDHLDNERPTA